MRTRNQLMDAMVRLYGMESRLTIEFFHLCDYWEENEWNTHALNILVEAHEANPLTAEQIETLQMIH